MTWEWVFIALLAISLIGAIVVLVRKFPVTATVDPAQAPKAEKKKAEIMETRLLRKFSKIGDSLASRSKPLVSKLSGAVSATQQKLHNLEHEYKVRSLPVFLNRRQKKKVDEEITELLEQAEACLAEGEQKMAEEKCMQAIRMEPRSVPAFELLGELYIKSKEYGHAKEVYLYLLKLAKESDAVYDHGSDQEEAVDLVKKELNLVSYYQSLAAAYAGLEDMTNAFAQIQEAYRLAPANPKVIDDYIEISMAVGRKAFAEDGVQRMKEVNPENKKIAEWEEKIAAMPETHLASGAALDNSEAV